MTNKQAFMNISADLGLMAYFFAAYSIDENASDKVELSGAFGFAAKVLQPDESQGKSSIKISATARRMYRDEANRIFVKNGISFAWSDESNEITGIQWA